MLDHKLCFFPPQKMTRMDEWNTQFHTEQIFRTQIQKKSSVSNRCLIHCHTQGKQFCNKPNRLRSNENIQFSDHFCSIVVHKTYYRDKKKHKGKRGKRYFIFFWPRTARRNAIPDHCDVKSRYPTSYVDPILMLSLENPHWKAYHRPHQLWLLFQWWCNSKSGTLEERWQIVGII